MIRPTMIASVTHFAADTRPALCALIIAMGFALGAPPALADVTRCDALAGHPLDPHKVALGVNFLDINVRQAVAACNAALKEDARNPRLRFELGRALERSGAYADAVTAYHAAAEAGYAAAQNALGAMYQDGLGVTPDKGQAQAWFKQAADQGYQPAVAALVAMEGLRQTPEAAAVSAPAPTQALPTVSTAGDHATPPSPPHQVTAAPVPPPPQPVTPSRAAEAPATPPVPTAGAQPTPSAQNRAAAASAPATPAAPPSQAAEAPATPSATKDAPAPQPSLPERTAAPAPATPPAPKAAPAPLPQSSPLKEAAAPPPAPLRQEAAAVAQEPRAATDLDAALTSCILPEVSSGPLDEGQAAQLLVGKCQRPWLAWVDDCVAQGHSKDSCIRDSTLITQTAIKRYNTLATQTGGPRVNR